MKPKKKPKIDGNYKKRIIKYRIDNNEQDLIEIMRVFFPIILKASKPYKYDHFYEDLLMAGRTGLLDAINGFNLNGNTNLFGYAYKHIKGEIMNELRNQLEHKRTEKEAIAKELILPTYIDLDEQIEKKQKLILLYDHMNYLPLDEFEMIMLHLQGNTFNEIGLLVGKSTNSIKVKYRKIIQKLKAQIGAIQ